MAPCQHAYVAMSSSEPLQKGKAVALFARLAHPSFFQYCRLSSNWKEGRLVSAGPLRVLCAASHRRRAIRFRLVSVEGCH